MRLLTPLAAGAALAGVLFGAAVLSHPAENAPRPAAIDPPAPPALPKADRQPLPEPVPVFQARWTFAAAEPGPVPAVDREPPQTEPRKLTRHRAEPEPANVCERHGLRKVITRRGRSWRCR